MLGIVHPRVCRWVHHPVYMPSLHLPVHHYTTMPGYGSIPPCTAGQVHRGRAGCCRTNS